MAERRDKVPHQIYEEYAYVIDYLQYGKPGLRTKFRQEAVVQLVGSHYFTLLEATVREGLVLRPLDKVYVGKESRKEITYIIGRIGYDELTATARTELDFVIEKIIKDREEWFVNFFNTARAITPRMHALELIPGIGKKYMWRIIDERERKPFVSFDDVQQRVNISSPAKLMAKRIIEELSGESKYTLFTRTS